MRDFRVRDVHLDSCGDREISRDRFTAYMRHLGINLVWVKRSDKINPDGSRQCNMCLETKEQPEFKNISQHRQTDYGNTCWDCRKIYGYSGQNRGTGKYMKNK